MLEEDEDVRDRPSDSSSSGDGDDAQCETNNPEQKKTSQQEDDKIVHDKEKHGKGVNKGGQKRTREGLRCSVRSTRAMKR